MLELRCPNLTNQNFFNPSFYTCTPSHGRPEFFQEGQRQHFAFQVSDDAMQMDFRFSQNA